MSENYTLTIERTIAADIERVFAAWTTPESLRTWWGPAGVDCPDAGVDLRVGGHYFIDNRLPDGNVVRISGTFERVQPPNALVYSWRLGDDGPLERVSVTFAPIGDSTKVTVLHERIVDRAARDQHEVGWHGCLDGLVELLTAR